MGIVMCDALRAEGWDVRRVNFGERAIRDDQFVNRAAEMWIEFVGERELQSLIGKLRILRRARGACIAAYGLD
jgi:hypothetical protein